MSNNSEHGTVIWKLLSQFEAGTPGPLHDYLSASPTRAMSHDGCFILQLRHQYGAYREDHWQAYSSQPKNSPWPGGPSRLALALLYRETKGARAWLELPVPNDVSVSAISAVGGIFHVVGDAVDMRFTGLHAFRVFADCALGPAGFAEHDIQRGWQKLAGLTPLDVVGPPAPDEMLGSALPRVLRHPGLGSFKLEPERPARYVQTEEFGPTHTLLADDRGNFKSALARASDILPIIGTIVEASVASARTINALFGEGNSATLISSVFQHDGVTRLTIGDAESVAEITLGLDGQISVTTLEAG